VVDSLPCTILGSATKRLKESDLVVTQPSKQLRWIIQFGNPNTTVEIQIQQQFYETWRTKSAF